MKVEDNEKVAGWRLDIVRAESALAPVLEEVRAREAVIRELWLKINREVGGASEGDRVITSAGKEYVLTGFQMVDYARTGEQPWAKGKLVKKDGSLSHVEHSLYHSWKPKTKQK